MSQHLILSGTPLKFIATQFLQKKPSFEALIRVPRRDEHGNILPVFVLEVLYVSLLLEGIGKDTPLEQLSFFIFPGRFVGLRGDFGFLLG